MKKDKSKKRRERDEDDDLEEMRDAFRKHKAKKKSGGGGDGENAWDKFSEGKNMRRILPRPEKRKWYTEGYTHFRVGPNERAVRCIDEAMMDSETGRPKAGTKCPLCKKFLREQARINSEYKKGDEDGQAEWKRAKDKYVPRKQYYANVLVADDDGVEVKIMPFGTSVWDQLMNYFLGDDTQIGDFTDLESGRWMNIKKTQKGRDKRNVDYDVYPAGETEDISDSWDDIEPNLHDLEAAVGKLLSKDEVIAIMKGVDLDKDEDDDSDDDDDDDDSASDSGSDEEEEEDEDADDDDEDERPSKKKSKLAMKMKKNKRRERDDDDEDEEEEDEDE